MEYSNYLPEISMKNSKLLLLLCTPLILLSSCASYRASSLETMSSGSSSYSLQGEGVTIAAKVFTKADCKRYLDRNTIAKGYQPVQLYIQNNTKEDFLFSLDHLSVSPIDPITVAKSVHTSTALRVATYSILGVFTCGLFFIPAAVDGIKSSEANTDLDEDFLAKTATSQLIQRYSSYSKLLFIPSHEKNRAFTVTLINQKTNEPQTFQANTF